MRRLSIAVLVLAVLGVTGAMVGADEKTNPQETAPPAPPPAEETDESTCKATTDETAKLEGDALYRLPLTSVGGTPDCPVVHSDCPGSCNGHGINCTAGQLQLVDTGETECDQGGTPFQCRPGKTIHMKIAFCSECACCSALPNPCVCPVQCTGENIQSWFCK